jgi:hypothetical protein
MNIGGYKPIYLAEDYDLWGRLNSTTNFSNLQEVIIYYRQHGKSVSSVETNVQKKNAIIVSKSLISNFIGLDVPLNIVSILSNNCESDYRREFLVSLYRLNQLYNKFRKANLCDKKSAALLFKSFLKKISDISRNNYKYFISKLILSSLNIYFWFSRKRNSLNNSINFPISG